MYDETSHAHRYFKYKVAELRGRNVDGNEADSEEMDGMWICQIMLEGFTNSQIYIQTNKDTLYTVNILKSLDLLLPPYCMLIQVHYKDIFKLA